MVVLWFLLSVVVSAITETLSSLLQFRGKFLWTSLDLLFRSATPQDAEPGLRTLKRLTAIPALNAPLVSGDNARDIFTKVVALLPGVPTDAAALRTIKRINPTMLVDTILAVQKTNPVQFGNTAIGKAMAPFAGGPVDAARTTVEHWVDDAMDRMTATYRANMRKIAAVIALVVVLPLGVDTLWNTQRFYTSSTARTAAIAVAGTATDTGSAYAACLTSSVPVDATTTTTTTAPAATGTGAAAGNAATPKACANDALGDLGRLGVQRYQLKPAQWISEPNGVAGWATMVFGLLLSAAAASMGAPFWFDVLKRAMGVRQRSQAASSS